MVNEADKTEKSLGKLALYRKYRPISLQQVVGQPQVTDIISASAKNHSFAHAYLFTGQRGTGKTTVARILAHLINDLDYTDNVNSGNVDIIEIDAASNNGVDDVREIRDSVQLAPMNCSHKVYIIDEFHMLSKSAFNALLKTIEEPPEYAVFILATTELQKVPATIMSRVQRFHFRPLKPEVLAKHLRYIADQEKINVDDNALLLIAERGGGSVRDSITLLDQLSNNDHIDIATVNEVLGLISDDTIGNLISNVVSGNTVAIINGVDELISDGTSPLSLAEQLIKHLRRLGQTSPELFRLIENLLDVNKSALPDVKLLSVLINFTQTEVPSISSASSQPIKNRVIKQKIKCDSTVVHDDKPKISSNVKEDRSIKYNDEISVNADKANNTDNKSKPNPSNKSISNLVWGDILQQLTNKDRLSTRSLLEQCDYRYKADSNELTLFFSRVFYRKQAKTKQTNQELLDTFMELYDTIPTIIISDDMAPADSDVAAVLNIVGGEVTKLNNGEI